MHTTLSHWSCSPLRLGTGVDGTNPFSSNVAYVDRSSGAVSLGLVCACWRPSPIVHEYDEPKLIEIPCLNITKWAVKLPRWQLSAPNNLDSWNTHISLAGWSFSLRIGCLTPVQRALAPQRVDHRRGKLPIGASGNLPICIWLIINSTHILSISSISILADSGVLLSGV